jgi:cytochrome c oxidase cbb3-type subunit 2
MNHETVEKNVGLMGVLIAVAISFGGLAQIVPLYFQGVSNQPAPGIKPYEALRLAGRDVYVREGCYNCHSQMIRPFQSETERYGPYSLAGESVYDHPFQFGSKRTGPDLARVGGRYSDDWQAAHLRSPRNLVPASIMPPYAFLDRPLDVSDVQQRMRALRAVGVPYTDDMIANAAADLVAQATPDADAGAFQGRYARARQGSFDGNPGVVTEMDALVAYLQMLGTLVDFRDVTPAQLRQP